MTTDHPSAATRLQVRVGAVLAALTLAASAGCAGSDTTAQPTPTGRPRSPNAERR